jgi:hypothetical protein
MRELCLALFALEHEGQFRRYHAAHPRLSNVAGPSLAAMLAKTAFTIRGDMPCVKGMVGSEELQDK